MLRRARLCHSMSSVCLSVTFRYRDHIGWNTSKIISRPNSLRPLLPGWPQHGPSGATGTPQKLGWNRRGVTQEHKKPAISPKRCKIGPRLLWRTDRKSHTRFRLVPKSTILDDLLSQERQTGKATSFRFCMHFHTIDYDKSPLRISGKVVVGVARDSRNFLERIARSSLQ